MDIFELLSFNFGDFVKTPAFYCIALGCLFLIVGIVLYLKENKKLKEENAPTADNKEAAVENTTDAPAEAKEEAAQPAVEAPVVVPTEGDGVKEVAETPVAETINFNAPAVEKLEETQTAPVIDTSSVVEPAVESLDSEAPVVYGGANPLENTAPIPTETVREAYGGAQINVEPVTEAAPVVETPVVETPAPVVEAPVVETPAPAAPVAETPAEEPAPVEQATEAPAQEPATEEVEKLEF